MPTTEQVINLIKSHFRNDRKLFLDLVKEILAEEKKSGASKIEKHLSDEVKREENLLKNSALKIENDKAQEISENDLFISYSSDLNISDIALNEDTKNELMQIVKEAEYTEKFALKGLSHRKKILFSGPPGTGKTMSAKIIANELELPLYMVSLHSLFTKYMGESSQKLKNIFDTICSVPGVYLFDEVDALAAHRSIENDVGEARRILNSFLQFLELNIGKSIIIATTNLKGILDRAFLRRFDFTVNYSLPDSGCRELIAKASLENFDTSKVDWPLIVEKSDALSAADIVAFSEDAGRRAVIGDFDEISTELMISSLEKRIAFMSKMD